MNTYVHTEGSNLKTFSKESYVNALSTDSCYIFTKKCYIELNMMLKVLIEFAYIRHS